MKIITYQDEYKEQIIKLILHIQNNEACIDLSIEEQPDLLHIPDYYQKNGGEFWIAIEGKSVIGTIALMKYSKENAILKKFFVAKEYRGKKVGLSLYMQLLQFAKNNGITTIVLDTPSVAQKSHKFYERAGFVKIERDDLPFKYEFPNRHSYLYMLSL